MKQTGQEARLNYIVEELKKDSGSCRDMEVRPRDRRRVMRSLMNIRMPRPLPAGFLEIQDEFLREEAREKGIVSLADIPTVKEQYGSGVLFGDRISDMAGRYYTAAGRCHCQRDQFPYAGVLCALPRLY